MTDPIAFGATVCWGAVGVVWVVAARDGRLARGRRTTGASGSGGRAGAAVVLAFALVLGGGFLAVAGGASWIEIFGLVVLVTATAFIIWARLALGAMWSVDARVGAEHRLCTDGPFAVTRHPIYTGALGMLLGTTVLAGVGELLVLAPAAFLLFEVKIRKEELMLVGTFPDEYEAYRRRVPQLVPGLNLAREATRRIHQPGPKRT
jgi:protein-S-isoprenylcysteine O-methyltransferase Ste14